MFHRFDPAPELGALLRRLRLHVESPDEDTLAVKRVPADPRKFNKQRTNLLIKRPAPAWNCCVCVDADLEYTGSDPEYSKAFASAPTKMGWRILSFTGALTGTLDEALAYAFAMLGAGEPDGSSSARNEENTTRLLAACSHDFSAQAAQAPGALTLFRDEEIEQVAGCVLGWHGRLALISGEAGVGKTNLLLGVAQALLPAGRAVRVANMGSFMAGAMLDGERESRLRILLEEARHCGAVLALEHAEWALEGIPRGHVVLREALDRGARLIVTCAPEQAARFAAEPLGSRTESVRLQEMCPTDTQRLLEQLRTRLSDHHGVCIDDAVEEAAVNRAHTLEGRLPGKAIALLDAAAARARLNRSESVLLIDVFIAAARMAGEVD